MAPLTEKMFPVKNKYQLPVIDSRDKIML